MYIISPISLYNNSFDKNINLIGSQCLYPLQIQTVLLKNVDLFDKLKKFSILITPTKEKNITKEIDWCNSVHLNPAFTYDYEELNNIFVSEEFYLQYFSENNMYSFNICYDLPIGKTLLLRRINGNFHKEIGLDDLLTNYFENCLVVNLDQKFRIDYSDTEFIEFNIDSIELTKEISTNILGLRLEEMNYTNEFNHMLLDKKVRYDEAVVKIINFNWKHHIENKKKEKSIISVAYIGHCEVNIDFVVSVPEPIPVPEQVPEQEPVPEVPVSLSKDEIRKKRLAFFDKA